MTLNPPVNTGGIINERIGTMTDINKEYEKEYYDEYRNRYYNPDDDDAEPGINLNWKRIQKGFHSVAAGDQETAETLSGMQANLETLNTDVETLKTDVETLNTDVEEIKENIGDIDTAVETAEQAAAAAQAAQAAIEEIAESIPADYSTLSEDVSTLKSEVSIIDEVLPTYKEITTVVDADTQEWENGYFYAGSIGNPITKTAYANTSCMYYGSVKEGDIFYVTARSAGSAYAIFITDNNDIVIDAFQSPTDNSYYGNAKYIVPEYGTKMYINTVTDGFLAGNKRYLLKQEKEEKNTLKSPLNGIKWVSFGDSLVEHNSTAEYNWVSYIDIYTGAINTDLGGSGTGFYRGSGENPANYIAKITRIPEDVDLITVCPSFNDLMSSPWPELPVGTVNDTGTETLAGYINDFFTALLAAYPTIPIVVMVTAPWDTKRPTDTRSSDYISVIKQICAKNGIPYNDDNFFGCGLKPWIAANKTEYYTHSDETVDGVHPNSKGHIFIYRTFRPIMEKNVLTLS